MHADEHEHDNKVKFGYTRPIGPERWAELSPAFSECAKGTSQSPVNIRTHSNAVVNTKYKPLLVHYAESVNSTLINYGFSVGVSSFLPFHYVCNLDRMGFLVSLFAIDRLCRYVMVQRQDRLIWMVKTIHWSKCIGMPLPSTELMECSIYFSPFTTLFLNNFTFKIN